MVEPGFYWWQRATGSRWEWTVVELSYDHARLRIHFLGTDDEEYLDPLDDVGKLVGPRAPLSRRAPENHELDAPALTA